MGNLLTKLKAMWPYFLVALILVFRNPVALFRAEFWAEDATEFFAASLSYGFDSLWLPVYGYHFFLGRVVAYLATFFPVLWTPTIYAFLCLCLNAFTFGYITREGFSWLFPDKRMRVFFAVLLALGPGAQDVTFNLCSLPYMGTLTALLLLLEKPHSLSWIKVIGLGLLAASAGPMFILVPLILYLWFLSRDSKYLVVVGMILPMMILNILGNDRVGGQAGLTNYSIFSSLPQIFLENAFTRFFVMPFAGNHYTGVYMVSKPVIFWGTGLIFTFLLSFYCWRRRVFLSRENRLLLIAFLCTLGIFGIAAMSRKYASIGRASGNPYWPIRYSFLTSSVVLMIWFRFFWNNLNESAFKKWLSMALMALVTLNIVSQWKKIHGRPDLNWPKSARIVQEALDNARRIGSEVYEIPGVGGIHPPNWIPNIPKKPHYRWENQKMTIILGKH